ncbi:glutathione S-transferase N-terminal domain-containing protein [Comamonas sp. NoAH]|uniref:glutathione S-transferase N-terminal domain-containing protein n=1 Tax=Comamonas halotolerans TaxID=3041496 RepID=UPI0024E0A764|nr:glutathione S-transferase N-terminal domain-containing protein [Comamonas sp. NoAH]
MQQSLVHPITRKWPAQFPQRLQLYSLPTPNGIKVSVMLEEVGIPYEAHRVDIHANDQFSAEFLALNPNNKIPAILDPNGPGGQPLGLFESGAILVYLAEKSGQLLSSDARSRYETLQWLMWQMGGAGPMFGQVGFFHRYGGKDFEDKRPLQRYVNEAKRLLGVLDQRLQDREWIMGSDYSIADIAVLPWIRCLHVNYEAEALLDLPSYANVQRVLATWLERPAVQRGLNVPPAVNP